MLALMADAQGSDVLPVPEIRAGSLRDEILAFYTLVGAQPTAVGLAQLDDSLAALPLPLQESVARILAAHNAATVLRDDAFLQVSVEDALWAYRNGARADLTPEEAQQAAGIIGRIDLAKMNLAGRIVLEAIEREVPLLERNAPLLAVGFTDPLGAIEIATVADDVHDVDRTILIDLGGDDEWSNNGGSAMPDFIIAAFPGCITTGGLDCTALNANRNSDSTNALFGRRCSFAADEASFRAAEAGPSAHAFVQGQLEVRSVPDAIAFATQTAPGHATGTAAALRPDTGCLPQGAADAGAWSDAFLTRGTLVQGDEHGVAIGIDVGGDDRFAPPLVFNDINNGNNAAGCDTRSMGEAGKTWSRNITAGGAFAGVGILWDEAGNDFYGGRSIAVGSGHVGGVGVLVDRGAGDDVFSAVRLSIGTGFFASLGLVWNDGAGSDRYALENDAPFFNEFEHFVGCDVSTRDGIGRGNFNGVGAVYDRAGDDVYFQQIHDRSIPGAVREDPTTVQGSVGSRLRIIGPPLEDVFGLGAGLLLDETGDDTYSRPGRDDNLSDVNGGWFVDHERV